MMALVNYGACSNHAPIISTPQHFGSPLRGSPAISRSHRGPRPACLRAQTSACLLPWDEPHRPIADCQLLLAPIESRVLHSLLRSSTYAASPSFIPRDAAVIVLGAEQFCPCTAAPDHAA